MTAALSSDVEKRIADRLTFVYGATAAPDILERIRAMIAHVGTAAEDAPATDRVTERDAILIAYGDQVRGEPGHHLRALHTFLQTHLADAVSGVHILPFYPYTSDDGFAVVDYMKVDPALGDWDDVQAISRDFKIMFDAVINHISASSAWFKGYLAGNAPYTGYFISVDPHTDLSAVTRPRTTPLLTEFATADGKKWVWTTFSADQIDLNYADPAVLLAVLEVLLFYVAQGAKLVRLDAIGYLWKQIGTSCIHLPQTHAVVQLMRAVLDAVAPQTIIITETNVPQKDNLSYFGDGHDEAQMVYQFPLPPLTLHALLSGDATHLTRWAATIAPPSDSTTFFNFLASHDGIGLVPARDIIGEEGIKLLADAAQKHGGQVSYKTNADGTQSAYELNITYFDALSDPHDATEPEAWQIARFVAAQAVMLALQGVPGIYFLSLLGAHNWQTGYAETKRARTLNRQKFDAADLAAQLADPTSHAAQVFARYSQLLAVRRAQPAFHPNAAQRILTLHPAVFAVHRTARDGGSHILALVNVSGDTQTVTLAPATIGLPPGPIHDLLSDTTYTPDAGNITVSLAPYAVAWLRA